MLPCNVAVDVPTAVVAEEVTVGAVEAKASEVKENIPTSVIADATIDFLIEIIKCVS